MSQPILRPWAVLCAALLVSVVVPPVYAEPGDLLKVTAARANLRAGPSDQANVRGQLEQGEKLLELRRDRNWYGVRVMRTGEEGWIYGNLLGLAQASTLGLAPGNAGFLDLSEGFDRVVRSINAMLGYPIVEKVTQESDGSLRIVPTPEWLRAGSRQDHVMGTLAMYQLWKNHQNNAPVRVVLVDEKGEPYVTIDDQAPGATLTVAETSPD